MEISITTSEYFLVERKEDMKNYSSSGSVYDPTTGNLVFEITGLRYHRLETRENIHAAHTYTRLGWKPDITFLDEPRLRQLTMENSRTSLDDEMNPLETLSTWNLHNATLEQNLPLDFFTMLASISGIVGQKGQANYAAGNVFLDSFAVYRHSLGLPACSVDLGVIEDVGYIHNHDGLQQNLDTSIWTGINESLLRKILRLSIFQQLLPIKKANSTQLITSIPIPQPEEPQLLRDARIGGLFIGDGLRSSGIDSKDGSKDVQALLLVVRV
ncbi:hypothetical protein EPUS_02420 [Endocarpon pusillum Z07020]|uniref:Ketoreductase domain-containing protein n=1 Tax=Endocarpon pusillum (strain Z07020 / HMAS-L-300199) TaxID=1263415 RepID=U1GFL1_ENDPU|nr:uncharacterized protein EPUS_02420 [Endocarpon pusillum Z07020]ERF70898.1 hypothetical protein EPUS_02420 [Endocarpon pusillum Z07020]